MFLRLNIFFPVCLVLLFSCKKMNPVFSSDNLPVPQFTFDNELFNIYNIFWSPQISIKTNVQQFKPQHGGPEDREL